MFIEVNWDYDDVLLDIRIASKILSERPVSEEELRNNVLSELSLLAPTKPDLPPELSSSEKDEYEVYEEATTGVGILEEELDTNATLTLISEQSNTDSDDFDEEYDSVSQDSDEDDTYDDYDTEESEELDNYDTEELENAEDVCENEVKEDTEDEYDLDNDGHINDNNIVRHTDVISRYSFSDIPKTENVAPEPKVSDVTSVKPSSTQEVRTEEVPKTLVDYLRKYPKSEISEVLKYFTQAEIDRHLRIGAICRSKNKLYI